MPLIVLLLGAATAAGPSNQRWFDLPDCALDLPLEKLKACYKASCGRGETRGCTSWGTTHVWNQEQAVSADQPATAMLYAMCEQGDGVAFFVLSKVFSDEYFEERAAPLCTTLCAEGDAASCLCLGVL